MTTAWLSLASPPVTRGTVYGTALNFRGALAALGEAVHAAPYGAPPRAPVLYIKPRNTWIGDGAPIPMPTDHEALVVGPSLGVVIGRAARRIDPAMALEHVLGYTLVNDVALPHASYFRPALRQQCRDGFCVIGAEVVDRSRIEDPDALDIQVWIDGALRLSSTTAGMIRPIRQLIAAVSEFMTLQSGDLLLTGLPANLPLARAGERVALEIEGVGRLENPVIVESALPGSA
jgi:5-oxopent-3-ene-1,2,5-tricarboxylate decarboxylase / 2-hydroxyhepta-2,4-diene-1,7-dioate isomerase